jgi:hypothetical protein
MTGPSARSRIPEKRLDAETLGVFITLALAVPISEKEAAGVEMPANMHTESLNAGFILRVIARSLAKTDVIAGGASVSLRIPLSNCASCPEHRRLSLMLQPILVTEILFR